MEKRSGRPRDPEVDARIVDAVRALLTEGGLDAVTMAAVAERAEVSRPALYRRYQDKEDLTRRVLLEDLQGVWDALKDGVPDDLPIVAQLERFAYGFWNYYTRNRSLSRAMLQVSLFSSGPSTAELNAQALSYMAWVAMRVQRAQSRGEIRADADVMAVAQTFFALYLMGAISLVNGTFGDGELERGVLRASLYAMMRGVGAQVEPIGDPRQQ